MWYTIRANEYCTLFCESAHMKHITKWFFTQLTVWYLLALLSLVALALLGRRVESQAGWLICAPRWMVVGASAVEWQRGLGGFSQRVSILWCHMCHSWSRPALRSVLLGVLWELSGRRGSLALVAWPWMVWLWQALGAGWSELCRERA
jgi:hypothetical protein